MKKSLLSLVAASILAVPAMAEEVKVKKDPKASSVAGMVKMMHILSDNDNTFSRQSGSAFLMNIKYKSEVKNNLRFVTNYFTVADTGLTDWTVTKPARGMFVNGSTGQGEEVSLLGEVFAEYKTKEMSATLGRQIWKSPLSEIKWSMMPNFYQGATYKQKAGKDLSIHAAHMTHMSYGSRSLTDFGLIGESDAQAKTTAGAGALAKTNQASFETFGLLAGVADTDSAGMTAVGLDYKINDEITVRAWDYYTHALENKIFADVKYAKKMGKKTKLIAKAQYLSQSVDYTGITGQTKTSDFSMTGAQLAYKSPAFKVCASMNQASSGDSMLNIYGTDVAYTSMIFSRNAYRDNVTATKFGASVKLMKGLTLKVAQASYSKSNLTNAVQDASETDIVLVYKPNKKTMFKIFNAQRTSELQSANKMNHVRAVAFYKF